MLKIVRPLDVYQVPKYKVQISSTRLPTGLFRIEDIFTFLLRGRLFFSLTIGIFQIDQTQLKLFRIKNNLLLIFFFFAKELAVQCEKGLPACPISLSALFGEPKKKPAKGGDPADPEAGKRKRDFESLADMEKRRKNERARLMEEIMLNDGV